MQTFTGKEYLKIDIASSFGLDKQSWDDRISWFDANEPNLMALLPQAETPALYYAGIQAWEDTKAGNPSGHMISLDATSSGLQILAVLTGDRRAAEICNVVATGARQDAYTAIYTAMLAKVGSAANITREMAKEAIMTGLYGSTAVPQRIFGEGAMLDTFYETMNTMAPAAWELNEAMLTLWDPTTLSHDWVMPDNFHVQTKVMGNESEIVNVFGEPFEVTYKSNRPADSGKSLGANTVHSIDGMIVREITRRCDYDPALIKQLHFIVDACIADPSAGNNSTITDDDKAVVTLWDLYQKSGYLSARILQHLNLENLGHIDPTVVKDMLGTLPNAPFKVVSVHDCFRCLPNYGDDLRRQYNLQLALIARSDLLQDIIGQLLGKPVAIGKLDPTLAFDIPATEYALS